MNKLIVVIATTLISLCLFSQTEFLDNSFGTNGMLQFPVGEDFDDLYNLYVMNDGTIWLFGQSSTTLTFTDFFLAKLNPNGTFDNSYGTNGIQTFDLGPISVETVGSMQELESGGFVVAGTTNSDPFLAKFTDNGELDLTFNGVGYISHDIPATNIYISDLNIQTDGKFVLTGYTIEANNQFFALRLNTNGARDLTFGSMGYTMFTVSNEKDFCLGADIQQDNKIVLAGTSHLASTFEIAVARLNTSGMLDTSFDNDGIINIVESDFPEITDVLIAEDQSIILGGTHDAGGLEGDNFLLMSLAANGGLNLSFGNNGMTSIDFSNEPDDVNALTQDTDGAIYALGVARIDNKREMALAKTSSTGEVDETFGTNGKLHIEYEMNARAYSLDKQSNGQIVIGGRVWNGSDNDVAVIKLIENPTSVGIEDVLIAESVVVSPNPATQQFTLNYTLVKEEAIGIDLYDLSGKLIQPVVSKEPKSAGNHQQTIVLKQKLAPGIYVLRFSNDVRQFAIQVSVF